MYTAMENPMKMDELSLCVSVSQDVENHTPRPFQSHILEEGLSDFSTH